MTTSSTESRRTEPAPRRIAHLHSSLGVYGAERWTLTLLKHLDRATNRVWVLSVGTRPGADSFYRAALEQGLEAQHLAVAGKLNPRAISMLRRVLLQRGIQVLHTHGFKSDVIGFLATRATGIRVVSTVHGWSADEGIRIRAYESFGRLFLRGFDRIYPLSPQLLKDLRARRFREEKLKLILNAVDVEAFDSAYAGRRNRNPDDPVQIAFLGRLCRPKGVFDLIEAFARVQLKVPAELLLVGEGPARAELQALCGDLQLSATVRFTGAVPSETVNRILQATDILVLPSHSEGVPRVIMEAFAAGVPTIGSAIPGVMQLIRHEDTGLLVPASDPDALARAIERLATDPVLGQSLAGRARRLITEQFSAHRLAAEFDREYGLIAGNRTVVPAEST